MKERLPYIDVASGIMIVWVLLFHALYPYYNGSVLQHIPFLYFFMPWFFYKSGMLFLAKDGKTECKNSAQKLLIPFVVWGLVGYAVYLLVLWQKGNLNSYTALVEPLPSLLCRFRPPHNAPLWFLPVLFLVRQIANFLLPKMKVIWVVLLSLCACVLIQIVNVPEWLDGLDKTLWGLFFFACGYWLRDNEEDKRLIVLAGLVYAASLFTSIRVVYEGGAPLWSRLVYYPACVMACVCFNNLCRWLAKWPFPVMSYVGRNAMHYYVAHFVVLYITLSVVKIYNEVWYAAWQGLLVVLLAYAIFLTLYSYLFNLLYDCSLRRQPYYCRQQDLQRNCAGR